MNTQVSSDHGKDTVGWPGSNFIRVRRVYDCLVTCFKIYIYIYKINKIIIECLLISGTELDSNMP